MSTYHEPSNGSFELYNNVDHNKYVRTAMQTNDNMTSPPGGPVFHPSTNVQHMKQFDQVIQQQANDHRKAALEHENHLIYSNMVDPIPPKDLGADPLDYDDSQQQRLKRQIIVLQADLFKSQRFEARTQELTKENQMLTDKLYSASVEINNLKAMIRDLESTVKFQKDSINRLTREKEFSSMRKGDHVDTISPQSTSSSQSISPPGSTCFPSTENASVVSEESYSQELEHLHNMVDMLRKTVLEQRNLFLKMGLQNRSISNLSQSASEPVNTTRSLAANTHLAHADSSQGDSLSGFDISHSLSNGILRKPLLQQHRQAEESSEKPTGQQLLINESSVVSDYSVTSSDIDLSDREKGHNKQSGNDGNHVVNSTVNVSSNLVYPLPHVSSHLVSNTGISASAGISSQHLSPHYFRMKNINDDNSRISAATINDSTILLSTEGMNPMTKTETVGLNPVNEQYSNMESSNYGSDNEELYEDARGSMENMVIMEPDGIPRINLSTIPGSPMVATGQVRRQKSQTEVLSRQPSLIETSDLPHKCKTEVLRQNHRTQGHPNHFEAQYPPGGGQPVTSNVVAFPNSEIRTAVGAGRSPQRYMLNTSNSSAISNSSVNTQLPNNNNIRQPMIGMVTSQPVMWPVGTGAPYLHRMPVSPSTSFSNSNTLSNISDVTSTCIPYNPATSAQISSTQNRININSSIRGPSLISQVQQHRHHLQQPLQQSMVLEEQTRQQQHYNNFNTNSNAGNNAHENDRLCPVCHTNLPSLSLKDFQAHVYDCFDNENGPETLQAENIDVTQDSYIHSQGRSCPMCQKKFPLTTSQNEFEAHVHRHFGEETFEVVSQ